MHEQPRSTSRAASWALTFEVDAASLDWLVAELWSAGCQGLEEISSHEVVAYFPSRSSPALAQRAGAAGGRLLGEEIVAERDWLAEYRRRAMPFAVGEHWWIDPRDPEQFRSAEPEAAAEANPPAASGAGRQRLRVPARRAFGTGSHATTALILQQLEELAEAPSSVLDVGCGSGILSIASRYLATRPGAGGQAASRLVAFDYDPNAVFVARWNAALNDCEVAVFGGSIRCLAGSARFDLMMVNVLPENLDGDEPELVARLSPGGRIFLSGILEQRESEVVALWRALGVELLARRQQQGWVALVLGSSRA